MAANENSSWERIQQGVKETERLIGQREYNASMVRARQTLEFMVKTLVSHTGVTDSSDLKAMIDALYEKRRISKSTCEHYHKIRIIGNKAVHEGDANAYNANQAYHMLSQEVYVFARDYQGSPAPRRSSSRTAAASSTGTPNRETAKRNTARAAAVSDAARSRRRQAVPRRGITLYDILKLLIPVLCIVLLFLVIRLVRPGDHAAETTAPETVTETSAPETAAETQAETGAPSVVYKTTDVLNVRPQPSTDSERIGQLDAGTEVEYVGAYDADWAIIMYNGQECYVASQYLTSE